MWVPLEGVDAFSLSQTEGLGTSTQKHVSRGACAGNANKIYSSLKYLICR